MRPTWQANCKCPACLRLGKLQLNHGTQSKTVSRAAPTPVASATQLSVADGGRSPARELSRAGGAHGSRCFSRYACPPTVKVKSASILMEQFPTFDGTEAERKRFQGFCIYIRNAWEYRDGQRTSGPHTHSALPQVSHSIAHCHVESPQPVCYKKLGGPCCGVLSSTFLGHTDWVAVALRPIQHPANASRRAVGDGPSASVPATHGRTGRGSKLLAVPGVAVIGK